MSTDTLPSGVPAAPKPFRAVLTPHRSLSRTGFLVLMSTVGLVSFVAGMVFLMIGAWPVLGFFGLDAVLVWLAFKLNYRSGLQYEVIEIADGLMTLTHVDPAGRSETTELPAIWVDVRLKQTADGRTALALATHGREHPFGAFLTDDERGVFARILRTALLQARGGPRI